MGNFKQVIFMDNSVIDTNIVMWFFYRYPIIGSIISLFLAFIGSTTHHILIGIQLPIIVMQLIQIAVWALAGVASILTIKSVINKNRKK